MTETTTQGAPPPGAGRPDPHGTPEATARLRRARTIDRIASRGIRVGGVMVLLAVIAIFVFVGAEAVPLLRGATVAAQGEVRAPHPVLAIGTDEYRANVSAVTTDGTVVVLDAATGKQLSETRIAPTGALTSAASEVTGRATTYFVGTADGKLAVAQVTAKIAIDAAQVRHVTSEVATFDPLDIFDDQAPIRLIAGRIFEEDRAVAVCASDSGLALARFVPDSGRVRVSDLEIAPLLAGGVTMRCVQVAVISDEFRVYVGLSDGRIVRWDSAWTDDPRLHESVKAADSAISSIGVVNGGETIVTAADDGSVATWFGVRASTNAANWDLTRIRTFPNLAGGRPITAASARRKGFAVLASDGQGRIDYATTGTTRAEFAVSDGTPAAAPVAAVFAPKNDALFVADRAGVIRVFSHVDPHPEAGVAALFSQLWYEGGTEPEHKWQSTGGTDDFEPKLSLTTLVFGTMKGVIYALLFSVPIALLAAIYTALFLPSRIKAIVKPVLEIMAALPSVVVGLLAALWLSPLVERNLASTFAIVPALLCTVTLMFVIWAFIPRHARTSLTQGPGVLAFATFAVALAVLIAIGTGPTIESSMFDGDLKRWIRDNLGLRYDPRNAMVVGFAMGFAVIPVIFTIAEDAISNVPKSLWAASEALGASRWQTTIRVVLPAATPGIFAAFMLGFGRAIGETMIVLMAAGNTPIMEMSPFNGMRTISACIAVEIPEAPHGDTLYRVLFLAGALLFAFTFLCNTFAELVGSRLRRRYGRAG